jgi:hypothetical protein
MSHGDKIRIAPPEGTPLYDDTREDCTRRTCVENNCLDMMSTVSDSVCSSAEFWDNFRKHGNVNGK